MARLFSVILFLFLAGTTVFSQEDVLEELEYHNYPTKIPEKLSPILEGDFKIPAALNNTAFRKIGNGIADVNLLFQYPLTKNFLLGAGFKFGYYQFVDFITNNTFSNSGKLFSYSPFGRISFLKFANPRVFIQVSTKAGTSIMNFNSFTCTNNGEDGKVQRSFFIEPQVGVHIFVDESLSFSMVVSDYIAFNNFNPSLMCMESFGGFNPSDSEGNYNVLGIGFGFTYFFNKKGLQ
jgi:hypothetical protein